MDPANVNNASRRPIKGQAENAAVSLLHHQDHRTAGMNSAGSGHPIQHGGQSQMSIVQSPSLVHSLHQQLHMTAEAADSLRPSVLHQSYPPSAGMISPPGRIQAPSVASHGLSQLSGLASHTRFVTQHRPYDYYHRKYKRLKKIIKNFIFINAAVCDEVVRMEEHVNKAKEERRFLLRKVLQYQSQTEAASLLSGMRASPQGSGLKSPGASSTMSLDSSTEVVNTEKTTIIKRKKKVPEKPQEKGDRSKVAKELLDSLKTKPKKSKSQGSSKKVVPPIPLDSLGRPVFPLTLGNLTVHSIGEIVYDRPGFHSTNYIYPIGYCSTRVYASISDPDQSCLYTCKVSEDDALEPLFEISPEDSSDEVLTGQSPDECHLQLLQAINETRGKTVIDLNQRKGGEFFGLGHPIVQNLVQSCPGARKCSGYRWVKYEVSKTATLSTAHNLNNDPTISFEALRKKIASAGSSHSKTEGVKTKSITPTEGSGGGQTTPHSESSTNLRSLLTSGPALTSNLPKS